MNEDHVQILEKLIKNNIFSIIQYDDVIGEKTGISKKEFDFFKEDLSKNGYLIEEDYIDLLKVLENKIISYVANKSLYDFFTNNKNELILSFQKTLFLYQLKKQGYEKTIEYILTAENHIHSLLQFNFDLEKQNNIIISIIKQLNSLLKELPSEFDNIQQYYSIKAYETIAATHNRSILSNYNKNDFCPCGSNKKLKKCCGEKLTFTV